MNLEKKSIVRVNELTNKICSLLEQEFSTIGIQGELSSFKAHSSGHWYFTLKDSQSQIKGVMFKGHNAKTSFRPKVGDEVLVWGKVTVYKPRGDYQVLCHRMQQAGEGIYQKQFEELKIKLKAEGLFDKNQALPYLPNHIVVITSEVAAALRDVLSVLKRRCAGIKVSLLPAVMEGANSSQSVIEALELAYKMKDVDLILITRGGGSAESLSAFNNEALARFAFKSPVPLVSAIGHEIDFTIMDFIADLRAATPSAAAELISKNAFELLSKVQQQRQALYSYYKHYIQKVSQKLSHYRLVILAPTSYIESSLLKLDDLTSRLQMDLKKLLENKKSLLSRHQALIEGYNPMDVMNRGYCLCFKENQVISSTKALSRGDLLNVRFAQGKAQTKVQTVE